MRLPLLAALCLAVAVPIIAADQPQNGTHSAVFQKHWKTSAEYTIAIAEQMPADAYSFKPTAEQMSFGEQMLHIANANGYFFSMVSGEKPGWTKPEKMDKESVMKILRASFDWSAGLLAKVDSAKLMKTHKAEGMEMTGLEIIQLAMDHTTSHRGQCAVYLRLKGIKPADYKF